MSLNTNDIHRIARLARIAVTDSEATALHGQLNGIFSLIEDMQAVNTQGVEPMAHSQNLSLRLRDDVVTETNQRELFQSIAPQVENGLYLVPKVIE